MTRHMRSLAFHGVGYTSPENISRDRFRVPCISTDLGSIVVRDMPVQISDECG